MLTFDVDEESIESDGADFKKDFKFFLADCERISRVQLILVMVNVQSQVCLNVTTERLNNTLQ